MYLKLVRDLMLLIKKEKESKLIHNNYLKYYKPERAGTHFVTVMTYIHKTKWLGIFINLHGFIYSPNNCI